MGLAGFVVSDRTRRALFAAVIAGESDLDRIVKKQRLLRPAAERALDELASNGLLDRKDGSLALTPTGDAVAREIKKQDFSA